jgi:protein-S-isoprenylcysteine O-methyltransferase Ste14
MREDMARQGTFLFRWRSYLPFLLVPFAVAAFARSGGLEAAGWDSAARAFKTLCFAVSLAGLVVRCLAIGHKPAKTSGRGTRLEAETLNTTGMYSVCRNPLYLGNFLVALGLALFLEVWWFAFLYAMAFALYYERIIFAEEEFLRSRFGTQFDEWSARTPAFVPNLQGWKQAALPFSWRAVLRREHTTLLLICLAFPALDTASDLLVRRTPPNPAWLPVVAFGLAAYLCLYALKRWTKVLSVPGR